MHGLRMSWPETNTCAYAEGFPPNMSAPVATQSTPKWSKEDHCWFPSVPERAKKMLFVLYLILLNFFYLFYLGYTYLLPCF